MITSQCLPLSVAFHILMWRIWNKEVRFRLLFFTLLYKARIKAEYLSYEDLKWGRNHCLHPKVLAEKMKLTANTIWNVHVPTPILGKKKRKRLQQFISVITHKLLANSDNSSCSVSPSPTAFLTTPSAKPCHLTHTKCGTLLVPWLLTATPSSPSGLLTYEMPCCQNNFPHFLLILLPFPNPFASYPSAFHIKGFKFSNCIVLQSRLHTPEIVTLPLAPGKHRPCEHQQQLLAINKIYTDCEGRDTDCRNREF